MLDPVQLSPRDFVQFLRSHGIWRFYLVWDAAQGVVRASHEALQPLAAFVQDSPDFAGHEGFFGQVAPRCGVLQGACVHRTCRGQAAGGVRNWTYDSVAAWLTDGMRLARGMTHKNALAGLWWGGGKGLIARGTGDEADRRLVYEDYGSFISSLQGCYVTAEDVGTSVEDMAAVFSRTRFTTCIPQHLGGSGNPSVPTARGVVRGMEAALAFLGRGTLQGKSVAVQGMGHVGGPLIRFLAERGVARVVGADLDLELGRALAAELPGLDLSYRAVERGDNTILAEAVDIVAPCATGGTLNADTIPDIRASVVCGAANNQLFEPDADDRRLAERGIVYVPDFLVNRMGIVNCADEQRGYVDPDPSFERHLGSDWDNSIYQLTLAVLERARDTGRTSARVAVELAEERSRVEDPVAGHRGLRIIQSLVRNGWVEG